MGQLYELEKWEHPFAMGVLTTDGIQYSAEKTTSTDAYETVEEVTVYPKLQGQIIAFEFGLTCALKSSGATEGVNFKWQARNRGGTWVDLHPEQTYAADASAYKEYTMSGRFKPEANLNALPIDMRLQIKSATPGGENAMGKTKNSSYVLVHYATG